MRRSLQLLMLPSLIWFLICAAPSFHASREGQESLERAQMQMIHEAEDGFYQGLSIAEAYAEWRARNAESAAIGWAGMGAVVRMVTVNCLGIKLCRCEKRLQLLEQELAERRAMEQEHPGASGQR